MDPRRCRNRCACPSCCRRVRVPRRARTTARPQRPPRPDLLGATRDPPTPESACRINAHSPRRQQPRAGMVDRKPDRDLSRPCYRGVAAGGDTLRADGPMLACHHRSVTSTQGQPLGSGQDPRNRTAREPTVGLGKCGSTRRYGMEHKVASTYNAVVSPDVRRGGCAGREVALHRRGVLSRRHDSMVDVLDGPHAIN